MKSCNAPGKWASAYLLVLSTAFETSVSSAWVAIRWWGSWNPSTVPVQYLYCAGHPAVCVHTQMDSGPWEKVVGCCSCLFPSTMHSVQVLQLAWPGLKCVLLFHLARPPVMMNSEPFFLDHSIHCLISNSPGINQVKLKALWECKGFRWELENKKLEVILVFSFSPHRLCYSIPPSPFVSKTTNFPLAPPGVH